MRTAPAPITPAPPDEQLVTAAAGGDRPAFEALIQRHFSAVFLAAYARLGQREAAEDLTQEVFLRAYLHLHTLKQPERFAAWICQVARHLASDWRRRSQTASKLIPMVPVEEAKMDELPDNPARNPREQLGQLQHLRALHKALEELPAAQREMLLLHYIEGLNDRELAQRLGIHRTTVRYHLGRALERCRGTLDKAFGGPEQPPIPTRRAIARTTAIIAAAGAMSASQKTAVAAVSGGMPGVATSSVALLKTFTAAAYAGASIMGQGKLAAGVAAAALLCFGGYYIKSMPGNATAGPGNGSGHGVRTLAAGSAADSAATAPVNSSDLSGSWVGVLEWPKQKPIRVVFHLERTPEGTYTATSDSPDQNQGNVPVDAVTVAGDNVKIEIGIVQAAFEGRLAGTGSIVGTLKQRGTALPLTLSRVDIPPMVPPYPERTEVKVDPALLDQYVGEYASGAKTGFVVSKSGDQLMAQLTGFGNAPLYPESESRFFFRAFDAQISFHKGGNGKIERAVVSMGDKETPNRKVK